MEEYKIDLESALNAAVDAARRAGAIMTEFYRHRRETSAASVPRQGPVQSQDQKKQQQEQSTPTKSNAAEVSTTPTTGVKVDDMMQVETKSSSTDLVTRYDKLCEETIINQLQRFNAKVEQAKHGAGFTSFKFAFITEEMNPDTPLTDAPTWIVDPIDGTMAFVHGACDCCVSIGLTIKKVPVVAVVYCPFLTGSRSSGESITSNSPSPLEKGEFRGELYTAIRDKGAYLNGNPIHVFSDTTLKGALVVFGYPSRALLSEADAKAGGDMEALKKEKHKRMVHAAGRIRRRLLLHPVQGIRTYSACVLILAQIAAGRVDLYMEAAGKIWDVCAASLLVTEAGGVVRNIWGGDFGLEGSTTIVAGANKEIVDFGVGLCMEEKYGDFWKL